VSLGLAGRYFFALSMIAFGIQNLMYKGFVKGLELTPEWLPAHTFWAYLMGAVLIAGGAGIALKKHDRLGAAMLTLLYFSSVIFLRLPRAALAISDIGERTLLLEPLAIGCGAWMLAWRSAKPRILFGISMIVFGIDHFQILRFIARLIPSWLPSPMFWAIFTGAAFIAAGLSIVTRWQIRLGATLLGLMLFSWVILLHAPRVARSLHDSLHNPDEWNSLFVALALCGVSWVIAEGKQR
jgi:uncharacterized membrane protein